MSGGDGFSKVLYRVALYSECARALTVFLFFARFFFPHTFSGFSKVLYRVTLYSECARALTVENVWGEKNREKNFGDGCYAIR
jgi:hypothetical protein